MSLFVNLAFLLFLSSTRFRWFGKILIQNNFHSKGQKTTVEPLEFVFRGVHWVGAPINYQLKREAERRRTRAIRSKRWRWLANRFDVSGLSGTQRFSTWINICRRAIIKKKKKKISNGHCVLGAKVCVCCSLDNLSVF